MLRIALAIEEHAGAILCNGYDTMRIVWLRLADLVIEATACGAELEFYANEGRGSLYVGHVCFGFVCLCCVT